MNILFDINHPAHVHLFRSAINILKSQGHRVTITARDKDVTLALLNHYQLPNFVLSKAQSGFLGLAGELLWRELRLFPIFLKYKIHISVAVTGACTVHVAKLLRKPSLVFYDTEHATLQNAITNPWATRVFTPDCYEAKVGANHIRYAGTHDLAYLHPKYFTPNPSVLKKMDLREGESFVIMRFVAWKASHDVGQKGFSLVMKKKIIDFVVQKAKVFIVSETPLEKMFEPYRLTIAPWEVFDVLHYATMYIGEGGSMATEAAVLGTPSIFISPLTAGVFKEFETKYDMMYSFKSGQEPAIFAKIENLLQQKNLKETWAAKRKKFLDDKIDVTDFMVKAILQYAS